MTNLFQKNEKINGFNYFTEKAPLGFHIFKLCRGREGDGEREKEKEIKKERRKKRKKRKGSEIPFASNIKHETESMKHEA